MLPFFRLYVRIFFEGFPSKHRIWPEAFKADSTLALSIVRFSDFFRKASGETRSSVGPLIEINWTIARASSDNGIPRAQGHASLTAGAPRAAKANKHKVCFISCLKLRSLTIIWLS